MDLRAGPSEYGRHMPESVDVLSHRRYIGDVDLRPPAERELADLRPERAREERHSAPAGLVAADAADPEVDDLAEGLYAVDLPKESLEESRAASPRPPMNRTRGWAVMDGGLVRSSTVRAPARLGMIRPYRARSTLIGERVAVTRLAQSSGYQSKVRAWNSSSKVRNAMSGSRNRLPSTDT